MATVPRLNQPPDERSAYIIPQLEGEAITIPGSKGVFRILASSRQTGGAMSVFQSDAVIADAPGFHHHNEAHDIFLVTKGFLKLYNGDRCLVMGPGDFASVPPVGDWIDFFRHIGEPFSGLLVPQQDDRDLRSILMPKIMAAKDKFDVVFQRPGTYTPPEVGDWRSEDEKLPEGQSPYYLKANTGPRWILGGVLSRPFITTKQSEGKFAISSIESSVIYGHSKEAAPFARAMTFEKVDHCFVVFEGVLGITLGADGGGEKTLVREGESLVVPAGQAFTLAFESRFVRLWSFASGDGVEAVVHAAGVAFEGMVLPDEMGAVDVTAFERACGELGVKLGM